MNTALEPPVRYVPGFIAADEASRLFDELARAIPWEQQQIVLFGKARAVPRLTCWFGESAYTYSGIVNRPRPWTRELLAVRELVEEQADLSFNSCLANLYRDGGDSIGWHADDEVELGPTPTIASVSVGAPRIFKLKHRASGVTLEHELLPGSLLVMYGPCQTDWLHAVPKRARVSGPRINLTFRNFTTRKT